jgi:hypothetical protein
MDGVDWLDGTLLSRCCHERPFADEDWGGPPSHRRTVPQNRRIQCGASILGRRLGALPAERGVEKQASRHLALPPQRGPHAQIVAGLGDNVHTEGGSYP